MLHLLRLIGLLHYRVPRLLAVLLAAQRLLMWRVRIAIPRVVTLAGRQRGRRRHRAAIPVVPSPAILLLCTASVLTSTRGGIRASRAEVRRRLPVMPNGNPQDVQRHGFGPNKLSPAVVPEARVPAVTLVEPVHAITKELIRSESRRVIDRAPRHLDDHRIGRHADSGAAPESPNVMLT